MSEINIEAGTPEAVAFRLMQMVLQYNGGEHTKEELLSLYQDCVSAVRGPIPEDLMAALSLEE